MCLITYKEADAVLDLDVMKSAFESNNDGWGLMAHKSEGIETHKMANPRAGEEKEAFDKFVAAYEPLKHLPLGVHFRARTHGAIDLDNTHPYSILSREAGDATDLWLMHNGVLRKFGDTSYVGRSDTGDFIDKMLAPLFRKYNGLWLEPIFHSMIEETVGSGNKMLIMGTHLEQPIFINKSSGKVEGKLWYSNTYSHSRPGPTVYSSSYFRSTHHHGPWHDEAPQLPVQGGGSKSGAPFCPTTKSSEPSESSNARNANSFEGNILSPHASFTRDMERSQLHALNDDEVREFYLESNEDPRIGGQTIPFRAIHYLYEQDWEDIITHNPSGVVDFLMRMGNEYRFGDDDDSDTKFRQAIFAS